MFTMNDEAKKLELIIFICEKFVDNVKFIVIAGPFYSHWLPGKRISLDSEWKEWCKLNNGVNPTLIDKMDKIQFNMRCHAYMP